MPKTLITRNTLERLFEETYNATDGFKYIDPNILIDNPKRLLIFRLALQMSQNTFEKFLGSVSKNSSKYELGKIRRMQYATAENIVNKLKPMFKPVKLHEIIDQFERSKAESNGWFSANKGSNAALIANRKGAAASLKIRRTLQEKALELFFSENGFNFNMNYPLRDNIIVDVFFPKSRLVIECKDISSGLRREIKEQVKNLAFQGFKIKFNVKGVKLWGLIETRQGLSKRDMEELQAFDEVFYDTDSLFKAAFQLAEVSML